MKRKNLIILAVALVLIVSGIIVFNYFTLENQILRDIDDYYATGGDAESATLIMNKINTLAKNDVGRFARFVENPKVKQFIAEWALKYGPSSGNT